MRLPDILLLLRPGQCQRVLVTAGLLLVLGAGVDSAQAQVAQSTPSDVAPAVAAALYDRGMVLFEQGEVASAKKMFAEALERSAQGSHADDALRMLRQCNEKLGIGDLDAGRPAPPDQGPLDPYANPSTSSGEQPLDPYGNASASPDGEMGQPLDPYGTSPVSPQVLPPGGEVGTRELPRTLMVYGGLYGFITGMALLGPSEDSNGDGELDGVTGGAVLAGLVGGGASVYLSYYLSKRLPLSEVESRSISSAGAWGMYNFAHLGNVFTGTDSDVNDIHKSMAIGGLVGTGAGYWYSKAYEPTEGELAFTNSMSLYGTAAGLLLGVAMDPPEGDAYSLNAALGSSAGLGLGLYLAKDANATRRRMLKVDIGAAAGAAVPWILVYPLMDDGARTSGFLSALSMGAGGYLAWYLTRNDSEAEPGPTAPADLSPAPPALLQRGASGRWSLSAPILRPMELPALAPGRGTNLGTDLLSGTF